MASKQYINIQYPFTNSKNGFLFELTDNDNQAIKSDLMHLLLTKKNERFYMPDFGTNLLQYIFEPNDNKSQADLKAEISESVKKYIPNLSIDSLLIENNSLSEYSATISIQYTVTEDVYTLTDIIVINI